MISINKENIFRSLANCNRMTVNSMMTRSVMRKAENKRLTLLAKDCNNIHEVIKILKADNKEPLKPTKQFYYFIFVYVDDKEYILSYDFSIVTAEDVTKAKFTPYIKYDIDDIRVKTLKPLECRLFNCKDKKEQFDIINEYIKKPYRRFKKWETKPNKLFLYHSYSEKPIEFEIKYE